MSHLATMLAFATAICPLAGLAQKAEVEPTAHAPASAYKLTVSRYATQELHATDLNLRVNRANQTAWLGDYGDSSGFRELRGGYERTDALGPLSLLTSLQVADRRFAGLALTAQGGDPFFVLVGFGRTNLRPYVNLNFDPNDAITLGAGWRSERLTATLYAVRDDRIVPGQQITHLVLRMPLADGQRATLDVFAKRGPADPGESIAATGVSATWDWPRFFVRIAYDPKVNFTQQDMRRVAIGTRF